MTKIVREHYAVADLPDDLRDNLPIDAVVKVTIETELQRPETVLSLEELFAMRRPPYLSTEEIVDEIRRQRDEWDD